MSIVLIILSVWAIAKIIEAAHRRARMVEARQAQIAKEQARQAKLWEKQRKEDAKRDAQLARHEAELRKHDEEIRKLKNKMKDCERVFRDMRQRIANLEELHEIAVKDMERAEAAGDTKAKEKALRKIVSIDNQLSSAEAKQAKARHEWTAANRKISA